MGGGGGGDGPRRLGREEGSLLGKRTTLKGLGKNNRINMCALWWWLKIPCMC